MLRPPPAAGRGDCRRHRTKPCSLAIRCGAIRFKTAALQPINQPHNTRSPRSPWFTRSQREATTATAQRGQVVCAQCGKTARWDGRVGEGNVVNVGVEAPAPWRKPSATGESLHPRQARPRRRNENGLAESENDGGPPQGVRPRAHRGGPRRAPRPPLRQDPGAVPELPRPCLLAPVETDAKGSSASPTGWPTSAYRARCRKRCRRPSATCARSASGSPPPPPHFGSFMEITLDFQHGCSALIGIDCATSGLVYCGLDG